MPQSIVLSLTTQSAIPAHQIQGAALQQLFFHLIDIVDPELGRILRQDPRNRGYSLSALQTAAPKRFHSDQAPVHQLRYLHNQPIKAKTQCWWRISFLDDELFDHLIFLWRQLKNEVFPLGDGEVAITQITTNPLKNSWANSCSYRDIYEQANAQERSIHLQFVTPTAFRATSPKPKIPPLEAQAIYTPLPTAEAIFHPLRKRWNRYSGLAFTPSLVDALIPASFNIQTQSTLMHRRNGGLEIAGCIGQISFRIIDGGDPLITKRLNTLADFIHYCPIGSNTLLGMGITHRIINSVSIQKSS
ncbi:MAG: CRISPR system precrRNA processing endoribonuclease RAMP protein Cas6 [Phormidesmis sp.]